MASTPSLSYLLHGSSSGGNSADGASTSSGSPTAYHAASQYHGYQAAQQHGQQQHQRHNHYPPPLHSTSPRHNGGYLPGLGGGGRSGSGSSSTPNSALYHHSPSTTSTPVAALPSAAGSFHQSHQHYPSNSSSGGGHHHHNGYHHNPPPPPPPLSAHSTTSFSAAGGGGEGSPPYAPSQSPGYASYSHSSTAASTPVQQSLPPPSGGTGSPYYQGGGGGGGSSSYGQHQHHQAQLPQSQSQSPAAGLAMGSMLRPPPTPPAVAGGGGGGVAPSAAHAAPAAAQTTSAPPSAVAFSVSPSGPTTSAATTAATATTAAPSSTDAAPQPSSLASRASHAANASLYQCADCQRRYSRPEHLARHIQTHTLGKRFPCPVCGKAFARADLLKRHRNNHARDAAEAAEAAASGDAGGGAGGSGKKRRRTIAALVMPGEGGAGGGWVNGATSSSAAAAAAAAASMAALMSAGRVSHACRPCAAARVKCEEDKPCGRCRARNIECEVAPGANGAGLGLHRMHSIPGGAVNAKSHDAGGAGDSASAAATTGGNNRTAGSTALGVSGGEGAATTTSTGATEGAGEGNQQLQKHQQQPVAPAAMPFALLPTQSPTSALASSGAEDSQLPTPDTLGGGLGGQAMVAPHHNHHQQTSAAATGFVHHDPNALVEMARHLPFSDFLRDVLYEHQSAAVAAAEAAQVAHAVQLDPSISAAMAVTTAKMEEGLHVDDDVDVDDEDEEDYSQQMVAQHMQMHQQQQQQQQQAQGLDVLDFCDDSNLELTDVDFGLLDGWNFDNAGLLLDNGFYYNQGGGVGYMQQQHPLLGSQSVPQELQSMAGSAHGLQPDQVPQHPAPKMADQLQAQSQPQPQQPHHQPYISKPPETPRPEEAGATSSGNPVDMSQMRNHLSSIWTNSPWRWNPAQTDSGYREQGNLPVPRGDASRDRIRDSALPADHASTRVVNQRLESAGRDRVMAVVLNTFRRQGRGGTSGGSVMQLVDRVAGSFPGVDAMDTLVHLWLSAQVRAVSAWLHPATLELNAQWPEWLAMAAAAGAVLTPVPTLRKFGFAVQEAVRLALPVRFEDNNTSIFDLGLLQTFVLELDTALWSGNRRKMEIAECHLLIPITMMRYRGKFQRTNYPEIIVKPTDEGEVLEQKWKRWSELESWKRLVFHSYLRDAQTSMTTLTNPSMSYAELTLPLPEASELWFACTADEWKGHYLRLHPSPSSARGGQDSKRLPSVADLFRDVNLLAASRARLDVQFSIAIYLHAVWALILEFRQMNKVQLGVGSSIAPPAPPPRTTTDDDDDDDDDADGNAATLKEDGHHAPGSEAAEVTTLLAARQGIIVMRLSAFSASLSWPPTSSASSAQLAAPPQLLVLNLLQLNLNVSLDDLQLFSGKEGEDAARRVYPVLQRWAGGRDARLALWHAGQVLRHARLFPPSALKDFYAVAVHHAALALWTHAVVSRARKAAAGTSAEEEGGEEEERCGGVQDADDQPVVFLDGDDADSHPVKAFVGRGRGRPVIRGEGSGSGAVVVPASDPARCMEAAQDILRGNFVTPAPKGRPSAGGGEGDADRDRDRDHNLRPPIVENLCAMLAQLGGAAAAVGLA